MTEPTFEGLDPIVDGIVEQAQHLAYITISDRTNYRSEEKIGRLDVTPEELAPWLDRELREAGVPDFESADGLDPDVLERGIHRWLCQLAMQHAVGTSSSTFRVRAYAIKGHKVLASGCFVVKREDEETTTQLVRPEPPVMQRSDFFTSFEDLEIEGSRAGMRALGGYYAQLGTLMMSTMRQVSTVHREMIDDLHGQVKESRGQLDEVLGALLETRAAASMVKVQEDAEARKAQSHNMLAQQAIHGIGEAAKAFAMAKSGVSPEMAGLAEKMGKSPELMQALMSADVQTLMEQPENLKTVAQMLQQAAKAMTAAEAAKTGGTA